MGSIAEAERKKFAGGYWAKFLPSGVPVPGFLTRLQESGEIPRDTLCPMNRIGPSHRVFFALELEHRSNPIASVNALEQALVRIEAPGYDYGPAEMLAEAVQKALHEINMESVRLVQEREEEQRLRSEDELRRKNLPVGREANMALIRSTLKRE